MQEDNVKFRLIELRKALGKMKQGEFAKRLGLKQSTWATIESGTNPLADRYIRLICLTFNVNEVWLRTGEGEIFTAESTPPETELLSLFRQLSDEMQDVILEHVKNLLHVQQVQQNP
jgi:transcriptional regulator with XRE-family HTH domain